VKTGTGMKTPDLGFPLFAKSFLSPVSPLLIPVSRTREHDSGLWCRKTDITWIQIQGMTS